MFAAVVFLRDETLLFENLEVLSILRHWNLFLKTYWCTTLVELIGVALQSLLVSTV